MSCDEVEKSRCRPLRVHKKYKYEEALQMAVGYVTDTFNTKAIVNLNGANGDSKTKTTTKTKKKGKQTGRKSKKKLRKKSKTKVLSKELKEEKESGKWKKPKRLNSENPMSVTEIEKQKIGKSIAMEFAREI
ncbi:hypothetical protein RUM44_007825 [Polyplax serrata]|uniref:Uncharacterized protein n=1 Tax=Polyplax serrata TaxID=468196 RepID=A0ABR1BBH1_POLSC